MTIAQGQATRANRSRILGSIFARSPRDTFASCDARAHPRHEPSCSPAHQDAHARPTGWRDVAKRHARETLAERICARFFSHSAQSARATAEAGFASAGQRLQALSGEADASAVGQQNLAAILDASASTAAAAVDAERDAGAMPARADITKKAA